MSKIVRRQSDEIEAEISELTARQVARHEYIVKSLLVANAAAMIGYASAAVSRIEAQGTFHSEPLTWWAFSLGLSWMRLYLADLRDAQRTLYLIDELNEITGEPSDYNVAERFRIKIDRYIRSFVGTQFSKEQFSIFIFAIDQITEIAAILIFVVGFFRAISVISA